MPTPSSATRRSSPERSGNSVGCSGSKRTEGSKSAWRRKGNMLRAAIRVLGRGRRELERSTKPNLTGDGRDEGLISARTPDREGRRGEGKKAGRSAGTRNGRPPGRR